MASRAGVLRIGRYLQPFKSGTRATRPSGRNVLKQSRSVAPYLEGPAIPPLSFGPLGGKILVADETGGQVHAIDSNGNVTHNAFNWSPPVGKGAENVNVIPPNPCTFGCSGGTFFVRSRPAPGHVSTRRDASSPRARRTFAAIAIPSR